VLECRKRFPNAKILLLGIFPRNMAGDPAREKIAQVNKIIAKLDDNKNVFFMDIGSKFLAEGGEFLPNTFPDLLHPNDAGYEIWGAAVKDKLAELMK
jgi:lysophospholipase L1-like esterase